MSQENRLAKNFFFFIGNKELNYNKYFDFNKKQTVGTKTICDKLKWNYNLKHGVMKKNKGQTENFADNYYTIPSGGYSLLFKLTRETNLFQA